LNSSQLKAFPVLLPPLHEQKAICDILASVDSRIELSEKKKSAAETLKKALMQDLLTGKVRVNVDQQEKESVVA
jgi:type I restriction enzyme S subunit